MKKIIIILLALTSLFLTGCLTITENGKHFGQITAIEDNGLIWKTTSVYIKTDISSSQEDIYCLDKTKSNYNELRQQLESLAKTREKITIQYHSELATWFDRCNDENGIIDGIMEEQNNENI